MVKMEVEMLTAQERYNNQAPLIEVVDRDDDILLKSKNNLWYKILLNFPWKDYVPFAKKYYDALYDFNQNEASKRANKDSEKEINPETKKEAQQRLLFERVTMQKEPETKSVIYENEPKEPEYSTVNAHQLAPGVTPDKTAGRKPKCFFSLLICFLGATLMGFPAEPEKVNLLLQTNPSFMRVCGFKPNGGNDEYDYKDIPHLRKLQQFDQIMKEYGIWAAIKIKEVAENLKTGVIEMENVLVGDTTHYYAYSGFETVPYIDENGNEKKKSQSKVTKRCNCENQDACEHPWELADEGAGTIVKSNYKIYWGHKASIFCFPDQGIPLDVVAVSDASTHDGKTLYPHLEKLFADYTGTGLEENVKIVLYDSAADDSNLKKKVEDNLGIELKTSLNPRGRKTIKENLPRGMSELTPYGNLICLGRPCSKRLQWAFEKSDFIGFWHS